MSITVPYECQIILGLAPHLFQALVFDQFQTPFDSHVILDIEASAGYYPTRFQWRQFMD
jgi:hypothetical protein